MIKITAAQRRKIFKLAQDYGLDNDLLHTYIFNLVGKKSIKKLRECYLSNEENEKELLQ